MLAPRPVAGVDHVTASVASAFGTISAEWTTEGAGVFVARYSLPFGVTATFHPPADEHSVYTVDGTDVTGPVTLDAGAHEVRVADCQVVSPAVPSL